MTDLAWVTSRPRWWWALAALGAACADSTSVGPNGILRAEKAAVLAALECGAPTDSIYLPVAQFILPYVDRAGHLVGPGGDTTRIAGLQLEIDALVDSIPVSLDLVGALAWTGFDSVTQTVDTVVLLFGTGGTGLPIVDSLREDYFPGSANLGTGFVIHGIAGGGCRVWRARSGALEVADAAFGGGVTQELGPLRLANSRGTHAGGFAVTAKLVPDSATTVSTGRVYAEGAPALRMQVTGELALP